MNLRINSRQMTTKPQQVYAGLRILDWQH